MELSCFEIEPTEGSRIFASVNVTVTSFFGIKRTVTRRLVCLDGPFWRFVDTGGFTPGCQCEYLYESFKMRVDAERAGLKF